MKERRRQFNPINQSRRIDPGYIKSIREAVETRVQLTASGVMERRRVALGGQSSRFSRDRIR